MFNLNFIYLHVIFTLNTTVYLELLRLIEEIIESIKLQEYVFFVIIMVY